MQPSRKPRKNSSPEKKKSETKFKMILKSFPAADKASPEYYDACPPGGSLTEPVEKPLRADLKSLTQVQRRSNRDEIKTSVEKFLKRDQKAQKVNKKIDKLRSSIRCGNKSWKVNSYLMLCFLFVLIALLVYLIISIYVEYINLVE